MLTRVFQSLPQGPCVLCELTIGVEEIHGCESCYCRPSCLAMKIHWALPTMVLLKRIRAENAVLRPLLGIIFACTDIIQCDKA